MYTTLIHKDLASMEAISHIWLRLTSQSSEATVFQDYHWLRAWYKYNREDITPYVVDVKKDDETVCLLPLCILVRMKGPVKLRELKWMGYHASDYLLPILPDRAEAFEALEEGFTAILKDKSSWDFINLDDVPQKTVLDQFLKRYRCKGLLVKEVPQKISCPYLSLDTEWQQVEDKLGSKLVKDILRRERRLREMDKLSFGVVTEERQILPLMSDLFNLHCKRWANTDTPSRYRSRKIREYHVSLAKALWTARTLHLSYLLLGNRAISVHFGMSDGNRLYYYTPAYDPDFERGSPGKLLIYYLIRDCHQRGYKVFDFMRGDESYKAGWGTEDAFNKKWLVYNSSIKSQALNRRHSRIL